MAASKFDKRLHPWTPRGKETKIGLRGKRAGDPEAKVAVPDGGEALEVDGKIGTGQRLIEIVDVEQDVVFRRVERPKSIR